MILARHADALLWAGRYLERAEHTSRCLNYAANSITYLRSDEAQAEGELLVRTLGLQQELEAVGPLESRPQLVVFLLSDADNPGSVVSSVTAVRENLRSVRDRDSHRAVGGGQWPVPQVPLPRSRRRRVERAP